VRLKLFATGAYQHVFLNSQEEDRWVYKIPAAFGYVVPYDTYLEKNKRAPAWKRSLLRTVGERRHQQWLRWRRRKAFNVMLELLTNLRPRARRHLVPHKVLETQDAVLEVGDRVHRYSGPILVQLRVDMPRFREIVKCDPQPIGLAQQDLWRTGVGLAESHEAFGIRGWALLDGSLRLADTSSLTTSRVAARRSVSAATYAAEWARMERYLRGSSALATGKEFMSQLRKLVNDESLKQNWLSFR
jgi:hypothetical protein